MRPSPRQLLLCGIVVSAFAAGCTSLKNDCKNTVDQTCERVFECQDAATKATPQFLATYGTDVANCKDKLYANPLAPRGEQGVACDNVNTEQQACTNAGRPNANNLSSNKALECYEKRSNLSCTDFLNQLDNPTQAPNACIERCS